ncbi:hypothetical protein J6590_055132 [Homalodisca vitripennis]|nr:hypothetical protein J6590_055132 [Homalodisca vitripennis]
MESRQFMMNVFQPSWCRITADNFGKNWEVKYFTGKHLNTLGLRNEDLECRLCNKSEETAKDIILDCERLGARRRALFGDKQPGDEPDASIGEKLLSLIKGTKIGLPL